VTGHHAHGSHHVDFDVMGAVLARSADLEAPWFADAASWLRDLLGPPDGVDRVVDAGSGAGGMPPPRPAFRRRHRRGRKGAGSESGSAACAPAAEAEVCKISPTACWAGQVATVELRLATGADPRRLLPATVGKQNGKHLGLAPNIAGGRSIQVAELGHPAHACIHACIHATRFRLSLSTPPPRRTG
jgi:hypothetical protein